MKQSKIICALAAIGSSLLALTANASFLSFANGDALIPGNQLAGTIRTSGWDDLISSRLTEGGYGTHGDQGPWEKSIAANLGVTTVASLFKTGGYGYVASSAIHQGFPGAALNVRAGDFVVSGTLIDDAATVIFQIQLDNIGGYAFFQDGDGNLAFPTLTIGGTTTTAGWQALVVNQDKGISRGVQTYLQDWAFQWDLTSLDFTPNADFEINWTGVGNSGIYALQLDQGDQFSQVIPESGHYALLFGFALSGLLWLRRRKG